MRAALVAVALLATGCGDDALPGCDPDVTCHASTGGSGTSGADDDGGTTSSGADDTTSAATTDGGDTQADTSSDDGTEDGSSTGASGEAEYRAVAVIGALDRIRITKHDLASDRCSWITLVAPSSPGQYDVDTPRGWSVEQIAITDDGDACESDSPGMFESEPATSATGAIEFGEPGIVYPCLVSPAVDAAFAGRLPGIPPMDAFAATDIPVEGC